MSEDEYDSPEAGQPAGNPGSGRNHTPSHRKGPRFSWNPQYEDTFFRSLCESVKMGLKDNHSFKSEAWDRACTALAERHNAYPNKGHLINKSDNARKKFRLWRGLREDPDFLYNPKTKMVTASEAAWRAHIEREPLSKSLRNRAFEHEDYMEILFPDVIGSGGAPKRITKPRRKGMDAMPDSDDLDAPGTNVMSLLSPGAGQAMFVPTSQTPILPPTVPSNGNLRPNSGAVPVRTSIASSSALTPPDDEAPQNNNSRKRYLPSNNGAGPSEKRRRANNNSHNYIDLTHSAQLMNSENHQQQDIVNNASNPPHPPANNHSVSGNSAPGSRQQFQEAMLALNEFVRNFRNAPPQPPPAPRWQEQAMETFFRDFADEDPDLQIRIGEKVLCDANKAMMFCMMSQQMRQHWVKRLRELSNRHDVSALGMHNNSNTNTMNPNSLGNAVVGAGLTGGGLGGSNSLVNGGAGMGAGMMQMGPVNGGAGMGRNGSQVG